MCARSINEKDEYLRNDKNIHPVLVVLWYRNHLVSGLGGYPEDVDVLVDGRKIQNDDVQRSV
jgi:hypothetical protein